MHKENGLAMQQGQLRQIVARLKWEGCAENGGIKNKNK